MKFLELKPGSIITIRKEEPKLLFHRGSSFPAKESRCVFCELESEVYSRWELLDLGLTEPLFISSPKKKFEEGFKTNTDEEIENRFELLDL